MNWIGLLVGLVGIAAVGTGLFHAFWPVAPGPDYRPLTSVARGELEQRIRRDPNEPDRIDPPTDLELLRTAAGIMFTQRNLLALLMGCFLIQLGTTLASWNRVHLVVTVVFAVPLGWIALYVETRARAGAAFLERYPTSDPDETTGSTTAPEPAAEPAGTASPSNTASPSGTAPPSSTIEAAPAAESTSTAEPSEAG